ncbi:MAG: hypothetical protein ACK55I_23515 [bacterium]
MAKHSRIDAIARASLGMSVPGAARTQYLSVGAK